MEIEIPTCSKISDPKLAKRQTRPPQKRLMYRTRHSSTSFKVRVPPLPPAGIEIFLSDLPDKPAGDLPSEPIDAVPDMGSPIVPAGLVQTF